MGSAGRGEHKVVDGGFLYLNSGLYLAFNQQSATMRDSSDGSITNYAGRMLVGAFDPVSVSRLWFKE